MKTTPVSYVKNFSDFNLVIKPSLNGKHFWMCVETQKLPYYSESDLIWYPNFIERLFGITPESKLARYEKKLFAAVLRRMNNVDPRVTDAIKNFLGKK